MKSVCLCGSFKFFNEMTRIEKFFTDNGVICYKPCPFKFRNARQPHLFVETWVSLSLSEKLKQTKRAELAHFDKIDKADMIYVVNPLGYVGNSVILEIGYAFAKGKTVYSQGAIEDFAVMSLIQQTMSPKDLLNILKRDEADIR